MMIIFYYLKGNDKSRNNINGSKCPVKGTAPDKLFDDLYVSSVLLNAKHFKNSKRLTKA